MREILHDLKDAKLWELWHIPYYGECRISIMNRRILRRILAIEPCRILREPVQNRCFPAAALASLGSEHIWVVRKHGGLGFRV